MDRLADAENEAEFEGDDDSVRVTTVEGETEKLDVGDVLPEVLAVLQPLDVIETDNVTIVDMEEVIDTEGLLLNVGVEDKEDVVHAVADSETVTEGEVELFDDADTEPDDDAVKTIENVIAEV